MSPQHGAFLDPNSPAPPEQVFAGVENAIRRQLGSSAELERVSWTDRSASFGFTVDGESYSLMVNVTE